MVNNLQQTLDICHLANYHTGYMALRSIPPSRKPVSHPYPVNVYRVKKPVSHHTRRRNGTLEALLAEAERLELEQVDKVKLLPSDEDLQRLDKLQGVITQLKTQIALRARSQP